MNLEILKQKKLQYKKKLNNFFKILFLSLGILTNFQVYGADLIITTSGTYLLSDDILATGDATNGTIRIQSSYVTLDLGGCFIKQTTATANCTGIVVDPGVTNLVIKNGTISGFTLNGISIGANCNKVSISNLIIENCTTAGVSGSAITVASGCSNINIDSILMVNCTARGIFFSSVTDSSISNCKLQGFNSGSLVTFINLSSCSRLMVSNLSVNSCSSSSNTLTALGLSSVSNSIFKDIFIENCSSPTADFYVISLANVSNCKFINCNVIGCSASGSGSVYSIINSNSVTNCQFDQCSFFGNTPPANFWGLYVGSTFTGNVINQLRVIGNTASSSSCNGIDFGLFAGASYNVFSDCVISKNTAGNISFFGIINEGGNPYNTFLRCVVSYNTSSATTYGLFGVISNWVVQDCIFEQNNGSTDVNSFGINVLTTNSLFSRNIAYANGPTSPLIGNQLTGVPIGSMSTPGGGGAGSPSTRISSAMSPWGNLRITS